MNSYNGFTPKQRNNAQAWLNKQWLSGAIKHPSVCMCCTQSKGIIDTHAEDYSEPFAIGKTDAYHLCFRCHMAVHTRFRNPTAFKKYVEAVAFGNVFKPFNRRDFPTFAKQHLDSWHPPLDYISDATVDLTVLLFGKQSTASCVLDK